MSSRASLILSRPIDDSLAFAQKISVGDHIDVIHSPLLEIVRTNSSPDLAGVEAVIFTSRNGVRFAGPARDMPAFCVGQRTTQEARDAGWQAEMLGETVKELQSALLSKKPEGPLLHIGGVHRRGKLAQIFTEAGIETRKIDTYDQRPLPLNGAARSALNREGPVIVPLFSPRTARQFASQASGTAPLHVLAMSAAVLKETETLHATTRQVASAPTQEAMVDLVTNRLAQLEVGDASN